MYKLVTKFEDLGDFVSDIQRHKIAGFDVEATGLDPFVDKVTLIQLKLGDNIYLFNTVKLGDKYTRYVCQILRDSKIILVGHNLNYDLKMVKSNYGEYFLNVYDTMIVETMTTNGLNTDRYTSLKDLVLKYCGIELDKSVRENFIGNFSGEFTETDYQYAALDVHYLRDVRQKQLDILEQQKQLRVLDLESNLVPVVASMEYNGVLVDREKWKALSEDSQVQAVRLEQELKEEIVTKIIESKQFNTALEVVTSLCLVDKAKLKTKKMQAELGAITDLSYIRDFILNNINLGSPKQMLLILTQIYGLNIKDTNEKTLDKHDHPIIKTILEFREHQKKVDSFGDKFLELIHPVTGRIHTRFNQLGARSGRFSSEKPNLLNIPRDQKYREPFIARPGYKIIAADFSQEELRLMAVVMGISRMIKAFRDGVDLHTDTGAGLFGYDAIELQAKVDAGDKEAKKVRYKGKAQPLDELVLTPDGWVEMGSIKEGDCVVGSDGKPKRVIGVFPQGVRPVYRVTFNDKTSVRCDEEHLWEVYSNFGNKKILTTKELLSQGLSYNRKVSQVDCKWSVRLVDPIEFHEKELLLDPYVMGALLGDGSMSNHFVGLTSADDFIVNKFNSRLPDGAILVYRKDYAYYVKGGNTLGRGHHNPVVKAIKDYGLMGKKSEHKFIPDDYKHGSIQQRLDLLHGLMDTDGTVTHGMCIYSTTSKQLADDISFVARSLGGITTTSHKNNDFLGVYDIRIYLPNLVPFSLPRKVEKMTGKAKYTKKKVKSIVYVGEEETQCILVDAPDHLYVTKDFILTHNTCNFAVGYGSTEYGLYKNFGIPMEEGKELLRKYFQDLYPEYVVFKDAAGKRILEQGWTTTLLGRKRFFEKKVLYTDYREKEREEASIVREGINTIIQGTGADIIKESLVRMFRENPFGEDNFRILIQVYDEIVCEIKEEYAEEGKAFVKQIMEETEAKYLKGIVPAVVDAQLGDYWKH